MSVLSLRGQLCALFQPLHLTGPPARTPLSGPGRPKRLPRSPQFFRLARFPFAAKRGTATGRSALQGKDARPPRQLVVGAARGGELALVEELKVAGVDG